MAPFARQTIDFDGAPGAEVRKLVGTRDSERGPSLFDAGDGVAQVVVPLQCVADQRLQLLVLEYLEPFQVGEGVGLSRRQRIRGAEALRRRQGGSLIVRTHGTRGRKADNPDELKCDACLSPVP